MSATMLDRDLPVTIVVTPPLPVQERRVVVREPAGTWTVADVVEATGLPPEGCAVSLDGVLLDRGAWATTVPRAGQHVLVATRPAGVESVFALIVAGLGEIGITGTAATLIGVVGTAAAVVGVSYGLSALAASLMAPGSHSDDATGPAVRRTIAGANNGFRPYDVVPQVLGKHRLFPPLAARSYTAVEGKGNALYQYALFTFGYGPLDLTEFKIGDQPLFRDGTAIPVVGQITANTDAFGGSNGKDVTLEIRRGGSSDQPITLFARDVQEIIVAKRLRRSQGAHIRRTVDRTTNVTVIVGCPQGLVWARDTGGTKPRTVRMRIDYRSATSTGAWTEVAVVVMTAETRSTLHEARSWSVTEGLYDVRVERISEEGEDPLIIDQTDWVSMLCTRAGDPVEETGLCLVAMKVKITNAQERLVDTFNAVAQTIALDWNGSAWVERVTSNPASLYRHVLQGRANRRPVADAEIDLVRLAAWHEEADDNGWEFRYVTQGRQPIPDLLRSIAASARAASAYQNGKFTVLLEDDGTGAAVQHLTPRNIRGFREVRGYLDMPHAFKAQWVDPSSGYLETERIVPADGYTTLTATRFERLDLVGVANAEQAYALARYHLAVLALRPASYEIDLDFEHLDVLRGDRIRFGHDVILVGLAAGRVVSVTLNGGGDATAVVVDQECPMAAATYGIRFRKSDGSTVHKVVTTSAGYQTTLTFATPITSGNPMPAAGDVFLFGENGSESIDLIVKEIEPLDELGARLVCVDAAPAVRDAASGDIPAYDAQITLPPAITRPAPPAPRVAAVESTSIQAGDPRTPKGVGIRIRFQPRFGGVVAA